MIEIYKGNESVIAAVLKETVFAPRELLNKRGRSPYENPNKVVSSKGLRYLEDHVEQDAHYKSVLDTRISKLLSSGWKIQPAFDRADGHLVIKDEDRAIAAMVQYILLNMQGSFEADVMAMMTHISRGFSLSEINYKYIESGSWSGKLGLKSIRFKEQENFAFDYDGQGHYTLNQVNPDVVKLDLNKFIHMISGFNDENPYGDPVAASCAFWVFMKEAGAKFWGIFQERFGQPLAILETDDLSNNPEAQKKAEAIIQEVHTSTGMVIPKGMVLRFMEAMRSGEANYRGFLEFSNSEISKAILGSTLTVETQKSASGTHALGSVHQEVNEVKFSFDIISSQSAINQQLIKRIVDYNFPGVEKYPSFLWNSVSSSSFITFAQGIMALMNSGVKIPARWAYEVLNIPIPETGDELLEPLSSGMGWDPGVDEPDISGVDNKALNSMGNALTPGPSPRAGEGSRPGIGGRFAERQKDRFADKQNRYAQNEAETNETVISRGLHEIQSQWQQFVLEISENGKIDFQIITEFEQKKLIGLYSQFMLISALRGIETATLETQAGAYRNQRDIETFAYYYKPFDDIIKEFKRKKILKKADFEKLEEAMRRKAFTVARAESNRVLQQIKSELDVLFAGRAGISDYHAKVEGLFKNIGILGKGAHIETVLRTNMQTQYVDARMTTYRGLDAKEFPQMRIEIVNDDATRDHHRKLSGYTKPIQDPVWDWLKPPLEYNCRCTVRAVHASEQLRNSDWYPDPNEYLFTGR